jgi:hypothetical protein
MRFWNYSLRRLIRSLKIAALFPQLEAIAQLGTITASSPIALVSPNKGTTRPPLIQLINGFKP